MAKPVYYSLEEACQKLNRDADGLKALARDGKLREFRDAGKVFFKAEDVDKLVGGGKSDTGELVLEAGDDELPSLGAGGTSVIGLAPVDEDEQKAKKEGTVISASGIGVFDDDELEIDADPMAKTQISSAGGGDQVSLEGSGGGSGLLDITRESDDTSLGAELLDEIYPGEEDAAPAKPAPRAKEPEVEETPQAAPAEPAFAPSFTVVGDASEPIFGGLMVGTLIVLLLTGSVAAGVVQGFVPDYGQYLAKNLLIFLAIVVLVPAISLGVGFVMGRAGARRA